MKEHSNNFETEIKTYGRQQAVQVIFEQDGQQVVLDNENVFSVTPNYKASLLKSAMKSLILDCNVEIPVGTRLQFKYGILVNNAYEYLNFGYYIVNKIEKKEDARSYEITCYDKMMLAMVDYINIGIEYPITIRNYIAEICNHLEIDFGSNQDQFVNYDKEIPNELYLDENGNSLEYTFRDVLDELSQVTASIICIDENDQLVVKYPQRNGDYETIEGTSLYIENADDSKIDLELEGQTSQDGTPTPSLPVPVNNVTGEQVVRVCGKNLLNYKAFIKGRLNSSTGQIEYANNTSNITTTNNTISFTTTQAWNSGITSEFIPIEQGQYIYKIKNASLKVSVYIDYYDSSYNWLSRYGNKVINANEETTWQVNFTNANAKYIRLHYEMGFADTITLTETQFEKGTTASSFEKYQGKDYEVNLGKNLLDQSKLRQGAFHGRGDVQSRLFIDSNYYISPGTYTFFSNFDTSRYRVAVNISTNPYPNELGGNIYDSGWSTNQRIVFTIQNRGYLGLNISTTNGTDNLTPGDMSDYWFMVCKGSYDNMIAFSPYFEPIELNKIGNYQDFIRKGTGKNLADTEKVNLGYTLDNNGSLLASPTRSTIFQIAVKPSTKYSLSVASNYQIGNIYYYKEDKTFLSMISSGWGNNKVITTPSGAYYISFATRVSTDATMVESDLANLHIQIEENSSVTYYEPFGYKDKWYIHKEIGKEIFDGSSDENWMLNNSYTNNVFYIVVNNINKTSNVKTILSNYYNGVKNQGLADFGNNYNYSICSRGYNDAYYHLYISNDSISSVADFKTWLQTNNIKVYYAFANPTYTLIENEELIEQLERVHLEQGLNNISVSSSNLPLSLKISYVSNLIGIDEEQLKDINVNFGEKYGPINSVVIARAADSDFIYKEDDQSVAENGLCEVKISDNQILNDDNRTQFLEGIYYQLKGTEFYLNDFSSTGIVYLDLLDYYKVKVFDNSYKCLMLNDEIDITQGLQEQVFTERPKESETEYKSIAKQDKDIRKIGIIVNKVEGEITAEIIARQDTDEKVSNLTQTIGEISTTVSTTTTQVEDLENRVYTNETSISQNSDSITATISRIQQTEDDVETLQTNTEDVVKQLVFGDDGLTISAKGTTSDDMKLNLTNDAIKFLYQNNAILTINGSTIEFSNASFKKLDLGNYVWQAEDDDSLSLIYEGE